MTEFTKGNYERLHTSDRGSKCLIDRKISDIAYSLKYMFVNFVNSICINTCTYICMYVRVYPYYLSADHQLLISYGQTTLFLNSSFTRIYHSGPFFRGPGGQFR